MADGGTGKTLLANHFAYSVARGQSWNGKPVVQGRVLIVQSDEPEVECAARLKDSGFEQVAPGTVRVKTNWQFSQMALFKRWIHEFQPALVIIDSLTAFKSLIRCRSRGSLLNSINLVIEGRRSQVPLGSNGLSQVCHDY